MYQRDIPTFCRIGFSVKEAADFTPRGYINIFNRLGVKALDTAWAKELLTLERRDYMRRFAVSPDKTRAELDREIVAAIKARAYAEARA